MSAKRTITFGDILDLLGRDDTEVTLCDGNDDITGAASSGLWAHLEERTVVNITPEDGNSLTVWLEKEGDDHDTE